MNRKFIMRALFVAGCAAVVLLAVGSAYVRSHSPHPDVFAYSKVMAAAERFKVDLETRQQPIPESVTLRQLLDQGFLAPNDAKGFEGLDVTVSLRPVDGHRPNEALVRVRFPNGDECVALGDGSVQQFRR